jgi:hypothetical protein
MLIDLAQNGIGRDGLSRTFGTLGVPLASATAGISISSRGGNDIVFLNMIPDVLFDFRYFRQGP